MDEGLEWLSACIRAEENNMCDGHPGSHHHTHTHTHTQPSLPPPPITLTTILRHKPQHLPFSPLPAHRHRQRVPLPPEPPSHRGEGDIVILPGRDSGLPPPSPPFPSLLLLVVDGGGEGWGAGVDGDARGVCGGEREEGSGQWAGPVLRGVCVCVVWGW
jgi:hypothetical protein